MRPRRVLAPRDAAEMFDRAVEDRALAVLTLQDGPEWHTFKSRFLERDVNGKYFVLDHVPAEGETLPSLSPGQYIGISFRHKSRKVLFSSVVEAKGHYVLDSGESITAIRYRWPETMTELQRRAYYRTPVPEEMTLAVSLWTGGAVARARAQGDTLKIITGTLADLSCGGAMVQIAATDDLGCVEGDILGIELHLPDGRPPLNLDARYRGIRHEETGEGGVAIQFIGLEVSPDGRTVLERLSNSVQKFHRLGMASGRQDWNSKNRTRP